MRAELLAALGLPGTTDTTAGVHVVAAEPATRDVVTVLVDRCCVVRVPPSLEPAAHRVFADLDAVAAFSHEPLTELVGESGQVLGLSWHHYGDASSLHSAAHHAVVEVAGSAPELEEFLERNSIEDWAESGFPREPSDADPSDTRFWLMRKQDNVVAAGNMTEWRGLPADVGVLVDPAHRGRGLAHQLTSAMLADVLPSVDVVRYRALSTNTASLAVAQRLGFQRYGGNYLARLGTE